MCMQTAPSVATKHNGAEILPCQALNKQAETTQQQLRRQRLQQDTCVCGTNIFIVHLLVYATQCSQSQLCTSIGSATTATATVKRKHAHSAVLHNYRTYFLRNDL
jgi:hypothetical protein